MYIAGEFLRHLRLLYVAKNRLRLGAETLVRDADTGLVSSTSGAGVNQIYTRNRLGELVSHISSSSRGNWSEHILSGDCAGRITSFRKTSGGRALLREYAYDDDGRVTEERKGGVRISSYVYDAQGNRTELHRYDATTGVETGSRAASFDARDRLLSDGLASYTYTYDDAGRRATKTTTDGDVTRYAYDELGHLTRVELPSGRVVEYTYDAAGRRTGRTTDGRVDGPEDTAWVYAAGPAPVAQLDGLGNLQAVYVYGRRRCGPHEDRQCVSYTL